MKKRRRATIYTISLVAIMILVIWWNELATLVSPGSYKDVDCMVETMMDKSATPGVAIVTSKQGNIEYKYYGYADVKHRKKINEESLFELGSTTKAFTALAIILLEDMGYIATSDYITDYISWFAPTYMGEQMKITIDQLLAHTSGIPSWSIRLIPEGSSDDMLEKTIQDISIIALDTYPGEKYNYATVNYDILALIIEEVTGQKYQDYVTDNILRPLGMSDSYFSTGQENISDKLSKGHKSFFGRSVEYSAPRYYGNIAAGYLVTNIKDLGLWINAHMGIGDIPAKLKVAIDKSHRVDQEIAGYEDTNSYYSYGWSNDIDHGVINHAGSNPNYSSHVIIDLEKDEAIFVLANSNSSLPIQVAYNIYDNMNGNQMSKFSYDDIYILLDLIFSLLTTIALIRLFIWILNLLFQNKQGIIDENVRVGTMSKIISALVIRIILLLLILIWPYLLNNNYDMIRVWMPNAILTWEVLAVINCVISIIANIKGIFGLMNMEITSNI